MKNIIRTLLAASLALTAIGCDQDQIATKFDPSAEAANTAYFVPVSYTHLTLPTILRV